MKIIISLFFALTFNSAIVWADNLISYIQMPISTQNFLAFSSQGLSIKECKSCPTIKLRPQAKVAFYEQNTPIDLKEATDLFLKETYDHVSVYYDRTSNTYDKVVFGGHIEIEPIPQHPNLQ